MADRYYSNTDEGQRFQPGTTVEAGQVDGKLDEITAGFQGVALDTDRSLKLPSVTGTSQELNATPLQRRRKVVGFDADGNLTLLQGFDWRGNWAAATEYFVNDVFRDPATKNLYFTITRHTSAAALSTDITAGRVELAISVEEVEQAKQDAQAARDKAQRWANESENTEVEPGQFSAKHHALKSAGSASASSTSAGSSATARDKSQKWAEENEDVAVEAGQFSAKHHAIKSAASAGASNASAGQSATARDKSQQWANAGENVEVEPEQFSARHHAIKSAASASASSTSAGKSATARDASQTARDKAQQWAEEDEDVEVETGQYSAKHYALKAAEIVFGDTVITDLQPGTGTQGQIVTPSGAGGLAYNDITIAYVQGLQTALNAKRALTNTSFPRYDLASSAPTGSTITLDFATQQVFRIAVTESKTIAFSNVPGSDKALTAVLHLSDASLPTRVINWPASIVWDDGAAPSLASTFARVLLLWDGDSWTGSVRERTV